MMNDMIHIGCEEAITAADEAQMEHERGEREMVARERDESWANLVAVHGPLMTDADWKVFVAEYGDYLDMGWKD